MKVNYGVDNNLEIMTINDEDMTTELMEYYITFFPTFKEAKQYVSNKLLTEIDSHKRMMNYDKQSLSKLKKLRKCNVRHDIGGVMING